MDTKTKAIAQINGINIEVIENGEKRIAIKPLCEVLGIATNKQIEKIKNDPILSSVGTLSVSTGADGKEYQMFTIPFKYVFGWLFRIDSRNVKEEAKETVLKYQLECYNAIYNYFISQNDFLEEKQVLIEAKIDEVNTISADFRDAKNKLKEAKDELNNVKSLRFEDWRAIKSQKQIEFTEET